jgi:hypothetical protein
MEKRKQVRLRRARAVQHLLRVRRQRSVKGSASNAESQEESK